MEQTIEIPIKAIADSESASTAVLAVASHHGITPEEAIVKIIKLVGKTNQKEQQHGN